MDVASLAFEESAVAKVFKKRICGFCYEPLTAPAPWLWLELRKTSARAPGQTLTITPQLRSEDCKC